MSKNQGSSRCNSAEKFSTLFDNEWKTKTSTLRNQGFATRTYHHKSSWDGKVENPEKFSRLNYTTITCQPSRPMVLLAGGAVHNLDNAVSFDTLNVLHKPGRASLIPLTLEQSDLGMEHSLRGMVPLRDVEAKEKSGVVIADLERFRNLDMTKPTFRAVEIPSFIVEAGPQCDQRLLNPNQRREYMNFEKRRLDAEVAIKSSKAFRGKSRKQAVGVQYQRGILMIDSSENEESEIYGGIAAQRRKEYEAKHQMFLERQNNLSHRNSSIATNGNFIIPDTIPSTVPIRNDYQSKGGDNHNLTFDETYKRLFIRRNGNPAKAYRTQNLRDNDLNGKEYNPVTFALIQHWPSKEVKSSEDKALNHPSQSSLDRIRNIQGTSNQRENYY